MAEQTKIEAAAIRALAEKIARNLFTDGLGTRAYRLALMSPDGRDCGGWCETAAADQIEKILKGE